MSNMSFTDLVKMIHPDLNPGITDAGGKMAEAVRWKTNEAMLFRLAVRWNLVPGQEAPRTEATRETPRPDFTASETVVIVVGDVIRMTYRGRPLYITLVSNEYNRRGILTWMGVANNQPFRLRGVINPMYFHRKATPEERLEAEARVHLFEANKKAYKDAREQFREQKAERVRQDLEPNRNYQGQNRRVRVHGRSVTVTRTTAKRVYYWDEYTQTERYVNFSSVSYVI